MSLPLLLQHKQANYRTQVPTTIQTKPLSLLVCVSSPTRTVTIPDNSMKNEVVNLLAVPWELRAILLTSVASVCNYDYSIIATRLWCQPQA